MSNEVPSIFPVGITDAKRIPPHAELADIHDANHLPSRLWFGDLEVDSFVCNSDGWSARYSDDEIDSYLTLELQDGRVLARYAWKNSESGISCPATSFAQLASAFIFPTEWEQRANEQIAGEFNARYFPYQEQSYQMCFVPDGPMFTVACPVRIPRLRNAFTALDAIQRDSSTVSAVNAYFCLALQVVNYVEGRNPDVPTNSAELMYWSMYATGLPPQELPVREEAPDGTSALTVRRPMYFLNVGCCFRDLFRVLGHLRDADLVGDISADSWEEGSYSAPEFSALVFHSSEEYLSKDIQFTDTNGSRRVFIPSLAHQKDVESVFRELASGDCASNAESAISSIEALSEASIQAYADLVNEPGK